MAASYITIPRDLTKVKKKTLLNLSSRQLAGFSLAGFIGVPVFFFVKSFASVNVAVFVMMMTMMPMFFFTMYEKNGRPYEVYLGHFIKAVFIRPRKRPYKTDNYYAVMQRQAEAEREVGRIVKASMDKKKEHKRISYAGRLKQKGAGRNKGDH